MKNTSDIVVPRMASLQRLQKSFKRLNLSWQVIETTARVVSPVEASGFIGTLSHTRAEFNRLADEMVEQISATYLANGQRDLQSRAQVAIDILVRNLFERTADVGFVATDGPLCNFIARAAEPVRTDPDDGRAAMHARLREYRAKYTVYDDIFLLDAQGRVLLRLQDRQSPNSRAPDWWPRLTTERTFIEHFGPNPFSPADGRALHYAHAVHDVSGRLCGAVVLQFDLASEMESIFAALKDPSGHTILLMLDSGNRVVASSDPVRFPPAEKLDLNAALADAGPLLRRQGVEYLFQHCATRGYQGYGGPGWTAAALVPVDQAFSDASAALHKAHTGAIDALVTPEANPTEPLYRVDAGNPQLQSIVARARGIERDLGRVIWNGKLADSGMASGASMHPVFGEIGRTSQQTLDVFDQAIHDLRTLLMEGKRAEMASHAALAVNIMDRNLYERANDCRWWALSDDLARLLHVLGDAPDAATVAETERVLAHLNSLYTVYRRIAIFDQRGVVLAVSRDAETLPPGYQLPQKLLERTLALQGTQSYAVSSMDVNPLAEGAATYLYCCPIRAPGRSEVIGGIALAFNCADELQAMLRDAIPAGSPALGLFLGPDGQVLSSSDGSLPVGVVPPFYAALQAAAQTTDKAFVAWQGRYYLAGIARSTGYREFKVTDAYKEDVLSVLLTPVDLPEAESAPVVLPDLPPMALADAHFYGVVQCGNLFMGLSGRDVIEAVDGSAMAAPPAGSTLAGVYPFGNGPRASILPVFDTCALLGQAPLAAGDQRVAVIVKTTQRPIVLLVNRLVDVITCDFLAPPPGGANPQAPWIRGLIHDGGADSAPVLALDPDGVLSLSEAVQ